MEAIRELTTDNWIIVGSALAAGLLLGFIYGRRGNATRHLAKIAKSLQAVAKNTEKR